VTRARHGNPFLVARAVQSVLVVASAAALLSGCGGHSRTPVASAATPKGRASRPPSDDDQLRALLATRARATEDGDAAALERTSAGAQRRRDRRAADAARPLPIDHIATIAQATDLRGDRAVLQVETIYGFTGVRSRFVTHAKVTAVRTPQGWRVVRERALGVRAPWELGRYTARRSRHFLALAPKGLQVGSLMSDLEAGRALMRHGLPGARPPSRMLVLVTRGGADARALTSDVRALGSLMAMAESEVTFSGPARRVSVLSSQRVVVFWRAYGDRSAQERRMVIAHELTHAALARRTSGRTPAWLVEGVAMYASGDQRSANAGALLDGARLEDPSRQAAAERSLSLARLARPDEMNRLSSIPLAVAYSFASAAAYAIAARHGSAALLRVYDAFNDAALRGRPGPRLDDRVLRHVLHESLRSVQADAEAFARAHAA
jgi:hypothetical protein